jgi:hypothetical protein
MTNIISSKAKNGAGKMLDIEKFLKHCYALQTKRARVSWC